MEEKLILLICERYDIKPSESRKVLEYLDTHISEIKNFDSTKIDRSIF